MVVKKEDRGMFEQKVFPEVLAAHGSEEGFGQLELLPKLLFRC